ncbi:sensor histidine kinase [Vibrio fluminensis]|uniref:sensor histidine kinase n=1 Tax=Vibrio fluminensis TaxID=2783614 RepID=UPI001886B021|nr:ATP-binding protein [Vibrio fluminensis]
MKTKEHYNLFFALFLSALLTMIGLLSRKALIETDVAMLFLLINIVCGFILKPSHAYTICIINIASFHYFFLPDFNSFKFQDSHYLITYLVLALSGIFVVHLTQSQRKQLAKNQRLRKKLEAQNALSRQLSCSTKAEQVANQAVNFLHHNYQIESAILSCGNNAQCLARSSGNLSAQLGAQTIDTLPDNFTYLSFTNDAKQLAVLVLDKQQAERIDDWFISLVAVSLGRADAISALSQAEANHQVEQVRTTLLASVSHDLKTPLGAIIGSATTLCDQHLHLSDEVQRELLHSIANQGERLNQSLTKLLDITRYTTGSCEIKRDWTEPEELIGSVLAQFKHQLTSHQLRLEGAPMLVDIDALLIEQVIGNLIENAAKYSPENSEIWIQFYYCDGGFHFVITNTSDPIPDNELSKIFDRFYRLENNHVDGTGLGLAICDVIVSAHGGQITVHNIADDGVQFHVTIPCRLFDLQRCVTDE